jgi:hypothetical protein
MANFDDTKIKVTSLNAMKSSHGLARQPGGILARRIVDHTDFEAAATSDTVAFPAASLKNNDLVMGIGVKIHQTFETATGSGTIVLNVGDGSNADLYVDDLDILSGSATDGAYVAAATDSFGDATMGTSGAGFPFFVDGDEAPVITVTSDAQNMSTTTQGRLEVIFWGFRNEDPYA